MQIYGVRVVLALVIVVFGLYIFGRSRRAARMAESAWYAIESRQGVRSARRLAVQCAVISIVGLVALLLIALNLPETSPAENPPTRIAPTGSSPLPTIVEPHTPSPDSFQSPTTSATAINTDTVTLVPIPTVPLTSQAIITNTDGGGLWMRDAPFGNLIVLLPEEAVVFVRGGLLEVDGLLWQSVVDADGREGWVAADYLVYR